MGLWESISPWLATSVATAGELFGLDEYNISEMIAKPALAAEQTTPAITTSWGAYQEPTLTQPISYAPSQPQPQPTYQPAPAGAPAPTSGSTNLDPHINPATGVWDDNYYARTYGGGGAPSGPSREEILRQRMEQAKQIYAPLYAAMDSYLASLPASQAKWETAVGEEVEVAGEALERAKGTSLRGLATAMEEEGERVGKTKQELEDYVRRMEKQARGVYGGTSGVGAVMTGVGREYLREMGQVKRESEKTIRHILGLQTDVETAYLDQIGNIQVWKAQRLAEIEDKYSGMIHQIKSQKAGFESSMLEKAIGSANTEFMTLQQQIVSYEQGISAWRIQKQLDLESQKQLIAYKAQFERAPAYKPTVKNLGTAASPDWRQYDSRSGAWISVKKIAPGTWTGEAEEEEKPTDELQRLVNERLT